MSENEVKKAFNAIEPEDGAQERMYANILGMFWRITSSAIG